MPEIEMQNDMLTGWKVVVIDDEPDNLYVAQALIETYGAEVHTATNGAEGLQVIKEVQPRFVVADVAMPQMSGDEMMRHLKADSATANIPVIALSAGSMLEDRDQAMEAGFHNYMIKPLRPQRFVRDLLAMLMDIPDIAESLAPYLKDKDAE